MFEIALWIFGYFFLGFIYTCFFKVMDRWSPMVLDEFLYEFLCERFPWEENGLVGVVILFWPILLVMWIITLVVIAPIIFFVRFLGWIMNKCKLCERKR